MNRTPRRRPLVANALLLLATLLLLLPLAEVFVRIVRPQTLPSQEFIRAWVLPGMYVADDAAGYRLAPSFSGRIERKGVVTEFRTNSLGLRGPELGPRVEERPRILALGDSVTWGWGVPQGQEWISVAARELADAIGGPVEGVNGGVNGYGTANELALLREIGRELRPELVIVGFFLNDLTDNLAGVDAYTVRDGYLFDERRARGFRESFLLRTSHLHRLAFAAWGAARQRWLGAPVAAPLGQYSAADLDESVLLAAQLLLRMRSASESLAAGFGVVWLPSDGQATSRRGEAPHQRRLQQEIAEAGVPSLDLLPVVRAQPDPAALYIPEDGHFSVLGNRVVGHEVARWLLEAGLVRHASHP